MENIDGIILINKPKGYTSHDVVAKVKKILKASKVGHTGTLDPNATGVLPLLINNGTKLSKYLIEHNKQYEVTLKLGIKTDTADVEGNIIEEKNINLLNYSEDDIKQILKSFIGKQEQIPPMYSALKVNGKKLYEYARNGQTVEIQSRKIEIYDCELKSVDNKENEIQFIVSCSKGTYIRSLCEDIALKFDTVGYMKELNRIKVGKFEIKNCITIEELEININDEKIKKNIITMEELLKDNETIIIEENKLNHFLNGVKITINKKDGIYQIYNQNKEYIGTGIVKNNLLKRDIIK